MNKLMVFSLSSMIMGCMAIQVNAMKRGAPYESQKDSHLDEKSQQEPDQKKKKVIVNLQAKDGQTIVSLPKEIAELSLTIKNLIDDLGDNETPIPFPNINAPTLKLIVELLTNADTVKNQSQDVQINHICRVIIGQNLNDDDRLALVNAINYLDIPDLAGPMLQALMQQFITLAHEDGELVAAIIESLRETLPDWILALLAKDWYLRYGDNKNFILPDLDYGFSIRELLMHKKLPQIERNSRSLDLSKFRINNIDGLKSIPNIASVHKLKLINNRLETLNKGDFAGLSLGTIHLEKNRLQRLNSGVFSELNVLSNLYLAHNPLEFLAPDFFGCLKTPGSIIGLWATRLEPFAPELLEALGRRGIKVYLSN